MQRRPDYWGCRPIGSWLLIAGLCATQSGCGILRTSRHRKAKPPEVSPEVANARRPLQRVGVVMLVNEADRFVLIDSGSLPTPAVGANLGSYAGAVSSGQLKASDVRRRPFVVADIVEGTPRVGDEVFDSVPPIPVPAKP